MPIITNDDYTHEIANEFMDWLNNNQNVTVAMVENYMESPRVARRFNTANDADNWLMTINYAEFLEQAYLKFLEFNPIELADDEMPTQLHVINIGLKYMLFDIATAYITDNLDENY